MRSVDALRDAIMQTDESVRRGKPTTRLKIPPKKDPGQAQLENTSKKISQVADVVSSLASPWGGIVKLFTGAVSDDWSAFVKDALTKLSPNTTPDEFAALVNRFVALRAVLIRDGYVLPDVSIPVWAPDSKPMPPWVFALAGLAALVGVILIVKR